MTENPVESMQPERTCAYRILRYTPNLVRDEWVNIGVLVYDPQSGERRLRLIEEQKRNTRVFAGCIPKQMNLFCAPCVIISKTASIPSEAREATAQTAEIPMAAPCRSSSTNGTTPFPTRCSSRRKRA